MILLNVLIKLRVSLQVLCPCAKRRERRDEAESVDDPLDDSDTNTLGLSAQDLRDPAAIVRTIFVSPRRCLRIIELNNI